ncbi:MAG: hypothetical protein ISEC1_P0309 [Thiomicrorhabdus sp.]|nr:MAG: hypothetical protein ISEC1_P0309 [Thiomicrorhabdus sp.]
MQLSTTLSKPLATFVRRQNHFQNKLGHLIAWSSLSLVLITALVVVLRYGFATGSIALQESMMYNHAILFMLGIAYTYQQDKHVRVDIFYGQFSERTKAKIDLIGTFVLTLPAMAFILWSGWDYVAVSWRIGETSAEAGGLAYLYLLKSLILIMSIMLISQALSIAAQAWLTLYAPPAGPFSNPSSPENNETEGKL